MVDLSDPLEQAAAEARRERGRVGVNTDPIDDTVKPRRGRPPKTDGSTDKTPRPTATKAAGEAALYRKLHAQFLNLGILASAFNAFDGFTIQQNAEKLARAWTDLAMVDARVRKVLEGGIQGGAWFGAIAASAGVAVPILLNHGVLKMPEGMAGIFGSMMGADVPPEPVESF